MYKESFQARSQLSGLSRASTFPNSQNVVLILEISQCHKKAAPEKPSQFQVPYQIKSVLRPESTEVKSMRQHGATCTLVIDDYGGRVSDSVIVTYTWWCKSGIIFRILSGNQAISR